MKTNVRRIIIDRLFYYIIIICSAMVAVPLFSIVGKVFVSGIKQLRWDFFTKPAPTSLEAMQALSAGEPIPGGIANGMVGMLLIVVMAALIAIPVGIGCGIYISENRHHKMAKLIRFVCELLQGVPSIVLGIVIYAWVVVPMGSYSAIAGAAAFAVMMIPLIARSTEETLNLLPLSLKESALALGTSYTSMIFRVWLPSGFSGIFTGVMLAVSRVMGETAPLMLTALGSIFIQWDVTKPNSSVSLLIWQFYNDPNLQDMIWSASLFLLALVLTMNICAKWISKKYQTV